MGFCFLVMLCIFYTFFSPGTLSRKVKKDFPFSNGIVVPAGTLISTPGFSTHHDSSLFKDAEDMDAFRFHKKREKEGNNTKYQMVTMTDEYLLFGVGRQAWYVSLSFLQLIVVGSPGRFFASSPRL